MLKTTVVYDVTITLNDGKEMNCLLLSKPDALTLAAIAESKGADTGLTEAMAFVRNLSVPDAPQADGNITEIMVAGTLIGTVSVVPLPAYLVTPKRGRKPKPADASTDETTDETTDAALAKAEAAKAKAEAAKAKANKAKADKDQGRPRR